MSAVPFDTLKLADRLTAGGFTAEQSRAAASAFAEAMSGAELATKSDLKAEVVRSELRLEAKIESTKAEIIRWTFTALAAQTAVIVGLLKILSLGH